MRVILFLRIINTGICIIFVHDCCKCTTGGARRGLMVNAPIITNITMSLPALQGKVPEYSVPAGGVMSYGAWWRVMERAVWCPVGSRSGRLCACTGDTCTAGHTATSCRTHCTRTPRAALHTSNVSDCCRQVLSAC